MQNANYIIEGKITCAEKEDGSMEPVIVINNKELSWEEFGETMLTYEGWKFKLEFIG